MNNQELKNQLDVERCGEITTMPVEDAEAIKEAVAALQKRFKTDTSIGYHANDFIENGYTMVIKLRPL